MGQGGWTRRDWLASASLASLPLLGCVRSGRPKNVVLLVSDGMSVGVLEMAESFSQMVRGRGTHWATLAADPGVAKGFFETSTLVSTVTDSAAASSAWGSGCKVVNGAINTFPDGTQLEPLLATLQGKRIATGLVTTARVTHATPAGFAAAATHRSMEDEIASQYLNRVDVILGGGAYFFDPEMREDGRDLRKEFAAAGYEVVTSRREILQRGAKGRVLGLFGIDHLPFTVDDMRLPEPSVPTLAEMTRAALERLGRSAGFFLMVEGARVDHAAHANDLGGVLWDQLAFDDAVGEALNFQRSNRDTLLVVTTDHGNANPGLSGIGPGYMSSGRAFERAKLQRESFTFLAGRLVELVRREPNFGSGDLGREVSEALGVRITNDEADDLWKAFAIQPETGRRAIGELFYPTLGKIHGTRTAVGWSGIVHTSDWALTLAKGPGQERFGRLQPHTAFYDHMAWFYGFGRQNQPFIGEVFVPDAVGQGLPTAGG